MFRTLQNAPRTISLFGKSSKLMESLQKYQLQHENKIEIDDKFDLPNYDQMQIINKFPSVSNNYNNEFIYKKVFPLFNREQFVDEKTYDLIVSDTVEIKKHFKPPIIVDWEHKLLANDRASLEQLLYNEVE